MTTFLPKYLADDVRDARLSARQKRSRLRVRIGQKAYPVIDMKPSGFTVAAKDAPHLRGLVDIYDGAIHLFQCLIVASDETDGHMTYEFKRMTAVHADAPVDFARDPLAPVALLGKQG
ncbi:MAG: hypothetical protein AAGG57_01900 [Pseudomonadota bacterium]